MEGLNFMAKIKGITVVLFSKVKIGEDDFNKPIYKEVPIKVDNVLVSPVTADDIIDNTDLTGKKAVYTLAIPKEDKNIWEDCKVSFFGEKWRVYGKPVQGINDNIPLKWNKKVMVEQYG